MSRLHRPRLIPLPTEMWRRYFQENGANLLAIPWHQHVVLTDAERCAISRSIREFQLGESSEGKHLMRQAKSYAQRKQDPAYPFVLGLFIAEENRHARDLGRIMDLAGIERAQKAWPDRIFRFLRHRAGLELSITVLVTAEIIAKVYYPALRQATASPALRRLCAQISRDEVAHVEFQTERLARLRRGRRGILLWLIDRAHRVFFAGTCLVVWHRHGRVLKRAKLSFRQYFAAAWREVCEALRRSDPRNYAWEKEPAPTRAPDLIAGAASPIGR